MTINYLGAFLLIIFGLFIMIREKNLIKIVMGMALMDTGINLLLVSVGYREGASAPIYENFNQVSNFVDPVPQALTLTSIVIGACVTALALSIVIKVKEHYGTVDADELRRLKG